MTISIDLDRTWTADPKAWLDWYNSFTRRGHRIIMITGRDSWSSDMDRHLIPRGMPILFCGARPKRAVAEEAGFDVDVWIDDTPESITGFLIETDDL